MILHWSAMLTVAAVALVVWPVHGPHRFTFDALNIRRHNGSAVSRYRRSWPRGRRGRREKGRSRGSQRAGVAWAWVLPAAVPVAMVGGPACGAAATVATATATVLARRMIVVRRRNADLVHLAAGTRALSRELRSGAAAPAAFRFAAESSKGVAVEVLEEFAMSGDRGLRSAAADDVPAVGSSGSVGVADEVRARLHAGFLLTMRHGVPLAAVTTAVAEDLEHLQQAQQDRAAEVAGPRFSGYVLAALPVLGLLLGAGMGANPVAVLVGSPVGRLLLLAGTVLACAGLLWVARIVDP